MRGRNVSRWWALQDSFRHYRRHVGLDPVRAVLRALYYEIRGKEPYS
jgi:hypothetical protein